VFVAHHAAIRAHPLLNSATLCYIFENNLGHEHDHSKRVITHILRDTNAIVLNENTLVTGFHTTHKSRLHADDLLRDHVTMNGMCFAADIISVNPDPSCTGDAAKDMLITQIADMKEYVKQMPNGDHRRMVTSIFSEDMVRLRGKHDDLQRALAMLVLASRLFLTRKLPMDYSRINGMRANRPVAPQMYKRAANHLASANKRVKY
jgi:hypothetical protein